MSAHRIAAFNFEFWEGDPPGLAAAQIETLTRAGTTGHTELNLGRWGQPFRARLTSHWPSYLAAMNAWRLYQSVIGAGRVDVIYNGINFRTAYRTRFTVQTLALSQCHANVRLVGPSYDFPNGGKLVTEWGMMPVDI